MGDLDTVRRQGRLTLADSAARGRMARDTFTFLHYPIVAVVVAFAVAAEEIALYPGDPLEMVGAAGLAGGVVLARLRAREPACHTGRLLPERLGAVAAVVAVVVKMRETEGLIVLVAVLAVVTTALAVERVRRPRVTV